MTRGGRMRAVAIALTLVAARSALAEPNRAAFLDALHDGRFERAREVLRERGAPTRPDELFFDAFTTYWQLVFEDDNPGLREVFEAQLNAVIAAAEKTSKTEASGDAALWAGSSHLLLAELRASQRRPLAAAFEAKKAKHLLESSSLAGADKTDALFGLGTYNYVADTVPSYVKGLRALLFLPKGDRAKGLEQLSATAAGSRSFALEARTLLVTVYANRRERLYSLALEERDQLLSAFPDSIASFYAAARLDISLGRNETAIGVLARAEERARTLRDVDPVVLRCIELLRARAELASFRPDRALVMAGRALAAGQGLGSETRAEFEAIRTTAAAQAEGIAWSQFEGLRAPSDEAAVYGAMATAHPERPLLALLAGDAELRAGRAQEALDWCARAVEAGLPPELQAGCQLRQGQAEDLLSRRSRAQEIYKRVAATSGFVARDAAYYYQQAPYRPAR